MTQNRCAETPQWNFIYLIVENYVFPTALSREHRRVWVGNVVTAERKK